MSSVVGERYLASQVGPDVLAQPVLVGGGGFLLYIPIKKQ